MVINKIPGLTARYGPGEHANGMGYVLMLLRGDVHIASKLSMLTVSGKSKEHILLRLGWSEVEVSSVLGKDSAGSASE